MTPIYDLTEWAAAQASPWVPHNVALRALEAVGRGSVSDRDLFDAPAICADGACYLIDAGTTPGDAWDGHEGEMAVAVGANAVNGWIFLTIATAGQILWVDDEAVRIQYTGGAWGTLSVGYTDAMARAAVNVAPTAIAGTSHVLVLGNAHGYLRATNALGCAFIVPVDSWVLGTVITLRAQTAGPVEVQGDVGVSLNPVGGAPGAGPFAFAEIGTVVQIKYVGADEWDVIGDVV